MPQPDTSFHKYISYQKTVGYYPEPSHRLGLDSFVGLFIMVMFDRHENALIDSGLAAKKVHVKHFVFL